MKAEDIINVLDLVPLEGEGGYNEKLTSRQIYLQKRLRLRAVLDITA